MFKKNCDLAIINLIVDMVEGIPELRIRCDEQDYVSRRFRGAERQIRHANRAGLLGIALSYILALAIKANPMPLASESYKYSVFFNLIKLIKSNELMNSLDFSETELDGLVIQGFCDG